jgi:PTS system nitrogen regulatory IIA component
MSNLSDLVSVEAIDARMSAANKKALFQQLAGAAAPLAGVKAKDIVAALNRRERLGSIFGYFARLTTPIDFQSIDKLPVDLIFLLLSPPDAGADHLKALARVSRTLRDRQIVAKLRGARSKDAIFALLAGVETLNAA